MDARIVYGVNDLELRAKANASSKKIIEVVYVNVTIVPKVENKKYIVTKDVLETYTESLMKIKDEVRKDVGNFYNNCLTNLVNKKLLNRIADITLVDNKPVQEAIQIDDYTEDLEELDNSLGEDPDLASAIESLTLMDGTELNEEDLEDIYKHFNVPEDMTLLIFLSINDVIYMKNVKHIENNGFYKGEPRQLDNPKILFPDTSRISEIVGETVIVTPEGFYVAELVKGKLVVRRTSMKEYFVSYKVEVGRV